MSQFFKVKNYDKFQHYRDRTPPWIKLYNELLDDYDFGCLPDASKMHLVAIWLLASRSDNHLPRDPVWIAKRINATEPVDLDRIEAAGFIVTIQDDVPVEQNASAPQAERLTRERDTNLPEKEKKDRLEPTPRARIFNALGSPKGFFEEGEFNDIATSYVGVDHGARLKTFWPWAVGLGKQPTEIKAMYVAKLKKEAGSTKLVESVKDAPPVTVSPELARSKLAQGDRRSRAA